MKLKNFFGGSPVKVGLPPGSLEVSADFKPEKAKVTVIEYGKDAFEEREVQSIEECFQSRKDTGVEWVNIDGLQDIELIKKLGENFDIHPLTLEDVVHTHQRPKTEDHEGYIYIVLRMLMLNSDKGINSEQVSLIFNKNVLISFQETSGDVFDLIRERLRNNKGRIRKEGTDYLAYSIIDAIVDHYFVILESLGERLAMLEDALMTDARQEMAQQIHQFKRQTIYLRRQVWPLRELISTLERNENKLIVKTTRPYLRDVYDHTVQVIDSIESFRDILSGMHDIYLSTISNKMNEVMKVLTIFAAIFIPLTFIAGIYGMNFANMPETKWHNGYYYALLSMFFTGIFILGILKWKKWI
ncbi:MAG: magnesium/cobalt transporter CorA [Candidatus Omnitrophica bacterium]|nr:magnesium/cobalt transporter CorA [Candidatus Omnitrophota bacterium]